MPPVPTTIIRQSELRRLASLSGGGFRLVGPTLGDDDVVLRGDFRQMRLRSGLILHATDTCEMHDLRTETEHRPGLTFSVFLRGSVRAWIGGRPLALGADGAGGQAPEAAAIVRAEPDGFARQSVRGTRIRKVNITVTPEWLADGGVDGLDDHAGILRLSRHHLATLRWRPSARLVVLAEQILQPPALAPLLQNLFLEGRAIDFVTEALLAVSGAEADAAVRPRDRRRLTAVVEFLESRLDAPLTLQAVAREAGMSVNTLQRLFRAVHGVTVFEYVRCRKLDRAREALTRDGVTVAQAAFLGGYASAANFATAFKRRFGVSPSGMRRHEGDDPA